MKHQSSASLVFVRGIHRWPVNSPHKAPVTRKMFPFDDVIVSTFGPANHNTMTWRPCLYPTDSPTTTIHDDVTKWKHFPRYWPFMRGIHQSPVNFPHKGQRRGSLMFSLICAWMNGWVNAGEAGDLRRHRAPLWRHCNDVIPISFVKRKWVIRRYCHSHRAKIVARRCFDREHIFY